MIFMVIVLAVVGSVSFCFWLEKQNLIEGRSGRQLPESREAPLGTVGSVVEPETRYFTSGNLTLVWDKIKPEIASQVQPISIRSNIQHSDLAGAQSCQNCHKENYSHWFEHSHHWMNALATESTILGDFVSQYKMHYLGGIATFFRHGDSYRMRFERADLVREYEIHQTIGSRFYQYYVGVGLEGPEPAGHDYYGEDHVLPFGYWIERKTWVPIVHVSEELDDFHRWQPVETLKPLADREGVEGVGRSRGVVDHTVDVALVYARACNYCHTTFPLGDMMVRMPERIGPHLKEKTLFSLSDYVANNHAEIWDGKQNTFEFTNQQIQSMTGQFIAFDAREKAHSLGVACEACHLGCREHAEHESIKPTFRPQSPNLYTFDDPHQMPTQATAANVNSICGRCHSGDRPTYAAGMATWNSTEFTDAMRGKCFQQASCVDCHDPHTSIGSKWKKSAHEDDASCLKCHEVFRQANVRALHTRHQAGSEGDSCMNCHMPKINEGMQDVVRTHTIFSPTNAPMIESNQPNACNLCHLDKSIDWTLGYLREWYNKSYSSTAIGQNYRDRSAPMAQEWLRQNHEPTRLVVAAAIQQKGANWALPDIIPLLDDPYLMNRQFAQLCVESLSGSKLDERFGYWYYMSGAERTKLVSLISQELAGR